jgi:predicted nicotinamide N-methyase
MARLSNAHEGQDSILPYIQQRRFRVERSNQGYNQTMTTTNTNEVDPLTDDTLAQALATVQAQTRLRTLPIQVGERTWQITAATDPSALSDVTEHLEHFPHGLLLWEAAIGLARWLPRLRVQLQGKRVLELGAGVGLPGLVARSLRAQVWQTDHLAETLALAAANARQNEVTGIHYFLADWREWNHGARYDLIVGADILYARLRHFYLERIFHKNLAPGGRLLLSDPGRAQALDFVVDLEAHGWAVELETLPVESLSEAGKTVEVTLLTCRRAGAFNFR